MRVIILCTLGLLQYFVYYSSGYISLKIIIMKIFQIMSAMLDDYIQLLIFVAYNF